MYHSDPIQNITKQVINEVSKQQEAIILEQLGDLVTKGLLVIESGPDVITMEPDNYWLYYNNPGENPKVTLKLSKAIRLVLKDKEYIEKLELENKDLKQKLNNIKQSIAGSFENSWV